MSEINRCSASLGISLRIVHPLHDVPKSLPPETAIRRNGTTGRLREISSDATASERDHWDPVRQRFHNDKAEGLHLCREQEHVDFLEEQVLCSAVQRPQISQLLARTGLSVSYGDLIHLG